MSSRQRICDPITGHPYERPPDRQRDIARWGPYYWTGTPDERSYFRVMSIRGTKHFYLNETHYQRTLPARGLGGDECEKEEEPMDSWECDSFYESAVDELFYSAPQEILVGVMA